MGDSTRRPLRIPSWQIPYLEKHRIFDILGELARELVIQQPNDHLLFMKQMLLNAVKAVDAARVIIIGSPHVDCKLIAEKIANITGQVVITDTNILRGQEVNSYKINSRAKINRLTKIIRGENVYQHGWILIDTITNDEDGKALIKSGILPTHVLYLIAPFQPPLNELYYCHVPSDWPEYRRMISGMREVFKSVLKEVNLQTKSIDKIVLECVEILKTRPTKSLLKPRILIIGPRGSGRKTQAKLLANALGVVNIDFEQLLCHAWQFNKEKDIGKALRECKSEVCFHSKLLAQVINKRILEDDCLEHGWVLTGFPFCVEDLRHLDECDTFPNRTIFLEIDLSICKERLTSRRINQYTGSVTHVIPGEETTDWKTHPKDNPDLIDAELLHFCQNYGEIRRYCSTSAIFINADQIERHVHEAILSAIKNAQSMKRDESNEDTFNGVKYCCSCLDIPKNILDIYQKI